jgi:hypothetical protein
MADSTSSRAIAERITERMQDFFHVASGPNEDGTHSGFVIVDFDSAGEILGSEDVPEGSIALLPFDLSDEDDPTELTTAEDGDAAADAAEMLLGSLLDLIEAVVEDELKRAA